MKDKWLIRRKNGELWLCNAFKPFKNGDDIAFYNIDNAIELDKDEYPEVTFEKSPIRAEICPKF